MTKSGKKKAIIFSIIAVVVVSAALVLYNPIRSLIALTTMKPLETKQVSSDVYSINNGFVNLYLVKTGNSFLVFDAGNDGKATMAALHDLGIFSSDVVAVFLTHTDGDHVAAVSLFPDAEVYMAGSNKVFLEEKEGQQRSGTFLAMNKAFKTMDDGQTITVAGATIQCIYTPGHTDGSASYVVNGKYLFTGDNLHLKDGKVKLFSDVFNMDNATQEQSIRRLAKLEGIEAIFTMHSGYSTDFKFAFSDWR